MATGKPEKGQSPRLSVRDQTLDTLRRRIISLQLPPGEPLSENELAQELGVSRTPVRESLILLREEGLVQVFPQIGSFVSLVDLGRVAEAQFVREAIECASLKDAGGGRRRDRRAAGDPGSQRDAEASGDVEEFFRLDEDFHRELLRLAGHESAWTAVNSAKAHLDRARRLSLIDTRPVSTLIEQHTAVVDALEANNAPKPTAPCASTCAASSRTSSASRRRHPNSSRTARHPARSGGASPGCPRSDRPRATS